MAALSDLLPEKLSLSSATVTPGAALWVDWLSQPVMRQRYAAEFGVLQVQQHFHPPIATPLASPQLFQIGSTQRLSDLSGLLRQLLRRPAMSK